MSVVFDMSRSAAWCRYVNLPTQAEHYLAWRLSYTDQSLQYVQTRYRVRQKESPIVQLLDKKQRRFPAGLLSIAQLVLDERHIAYTVKRSSNRIEPVPVERPDWLWKHQLEAITASLEKERGIVRLPTGSGKTTVAAELIRSFPHAKRILVTVPRRTLLHKTVKFLSSYLHVPIGAVGDQQKQYERITVGIVDSLIHADADDLVRLSEVDLWIADECHRVGSEKYQELGDLLFNAYRRIGLSATPWRSDGSNLVMEGILGSILVAVKETEMSSRNIICTPTYLQIPHTHPADQIYSGGHKQNGKVVYRTPDGKPERNAVYEQAICYNAERNRLCVEVIKSWYEACPHSVGLVFVNRVVHGELLQRSLGFEVPFLYYKTKRKDRLKWLDEMRTGELRLLIAGSVLNEGEDIPNLDIVFLFGGESNSRNVLQQVGRVVRRPSADANAIVIDIADVGEPYYFSAASERRFKTLQRSYGVKKLQVTQLSQLYNYWETLKEK